MTNNRPHPMCFAGLNLVPHGVALNVKGADMALITINLPDADSCDGVSLATLEAHIAGKGNRSVEEYINRLIADALGFRPPGGEVTPRYPYLAQLEQDLGLKR